ncbi:MAG TPA: hypothetical protein VN641_06165 [Urbifossiella sp.]|nr:hypothetical protein [Urbifossiella sp.]
MLVLRDAGETDLPFEVRLRALLKAALRSWHLRCESVQRLTIAAELARSRDECLRLAEENAKLRRRLKRREKAA